MVVIFSLCIEVTMVFPSTLVQLTIKLTNKVHLACFLYHVLCCFPPRFVFPSNNRISAVTHIGCLFTNYHLLTSKMTHLMTLPYFSHSSFVSASRSSSTSPLPTMFYNQPRTHTLSSSLIYTCLPPPQKRQKSLDFYFSGATPLTRNNTTFVGHLRISVRGLTSFFFASVEGGIQQESNVIAQLLLSTEQTLNSVAR